jgi:hypothetical protein
MRNQRSFIFRWTIGIGAALFGAAATNANLTSIQAPPSREQDQAQILGHAYGGTFVSDGNDLTNGAIRAVRLDDATGDQVFAGGTYSVRTLAQFAQRQQGFGYFDGASGGSYHKLFEVSGSNYAATGSKTNVNTSTESIRFAMNGKSAVYTTASADNANAKDAAITYRIDGLGDNLVRYALFWENLNADEPSGVKTVNDYNDLAVEVSRGGPSAANGAAAAAPLPAAVWSGGALLVGVLALMRKPSTRVA